MKWSTRKNPLTGEWVIFCPERAQRPGGSLEGKKKTPPSSSDNPFAPGNESETPPEIAAVRDPGSKPNQPGWSVRVFPNKYPALNARETIAFETDGFFEWGKSAGGHEVIVETPEPAQTLAQQSVKNLAGVFATYQERMAEWAKDERIECVEVFKNAGANAGATQPHPHSQLLALPFLPPRLERKWQSAQNYFLKNERNFFEDWIQKEIENGERVVFQNDDILAVSVFAGRFPYEIHILPRQPEPFFHHTRLFKPLAEALQTVLSAYQEKLNAPDYNFILTSAPLRASAQEASAFCWHMEIFPRVTGIGGFELGSGTWLNAVLPEEAAKFLRKERA